FPGGRGRLRLTASEPPPPAVEGEEATDEPPPEAEPGIELIVRPAGKRIESLSLLSGGEKSLTAIAFLFSLLLTKPSPFYLLAEIAAEPQIWERWGEVSEGDLRAKLAGTDDATAMVVELHGEVAGLIQYHEETDPDYRHAGVDMFLAGKARGQGYGREALLLV